MFQIATIERQVFDFLGYMWAPIITNFLQIIFIIIGFFGALQYRPKVVISVGILTSIYNMYLVPGTRSKLINDLQTCLL